jgi:CubicO group peptidase (beta-lactamase class C family)
MAFRDFPRSAAPEISRRSLLRTGGYLAGAAAAATLPFHRALLAHDVAEAWPQVAAMAEKYVREKKVANMLLTFGWRQEDHAHTVGGGTLSLNGGDEVDENTLYRIYSMTKPITGMAVMMLIDEGKLGLDMPVHEVLPAFRDMQVLVDPAGPIDQTVPAIRPITIRQLLTHTSGLGYAITSKGPLLDAYVEQGITAGRVSRFPIPGVPMPQEPPSLAVWADRLATLPLMYQPATKWSYSASLDLLGRVIEVVSGMEFEAFLKARLFDPLGMTSTFMTVPAGEKDRLTDNYGVLGEAILPLDPGANSIYLDPASVPLGGGGLVSSPRDYDRFLRMLLGYGKLGNERLMGELAVRVGVSNLIPRTVDTKGSLEPGEGHGAGGRSKGDVFGWGGAAGTLAAVDYSLGLRTALWTQFMPPEAYPVREEYIAALEADLKAMRSTM